jgi:hypothetical protein
MQAVGLRGLTELMYSSYCSFLLMYSNGTRPSVEAGASVSQASTSTV